MLCKQGEMSLLRLMSTSAQVAPLVSVSVWFAAAVFAAISALALPVDIELLSVVCAAHLQIAILFGSRMASKRSYTNLAFSMGRPSDFKIVCASTKHQSHV